MMRRRNSSNPFTSPVLIGALTVLVMVVAVVLAFQANNGLPFVPRYDLHLEVPNAEELVHGGEVHMGGALVGSVNSVTASRDRAGAPVAVVNMALNKTIEPLPVDSHFTIRMKSSLGEKYVEITLGHSRRTWPNGATIPLGHSSATVDLDQVLDMYTPPTQVGVQATTNGFGQALAGRGADLNQAIGAFVPLVKDLTPVMRNLASPTTNLKGFITGLARFTSALAPVARQEAALFVGMDQTFKALASVANPYLQQWIAQTPPTESTLIADAPTIAPFASDVATLFAKLDPGFRTLPSSAPEYAAALKAGIKSLPGTAQLDQQTVSLSKALDSFGADTTTVQPGLERLTLTAKDLQDPLAFLTPVQATCNYITLFFRNLASALSDTVGGGTVLRAVAVVIDNDVAGGEGGPSSVPYTSYGSEGAAGTSGHEVQHGLLHYDPYPNTASPGQTVECTAGNEPYNGDTAVIGNPTTNVGTATEKTTASGG